MASSKEYTNKQLNYFRICYITTDILAEGLRTVFKQEWDNQYKSTMGEWKDDPKNGMDFYNGESSLNQKRNAHLLANMRKGNRSEWDCTMLFYAILFSDCIGHGLNAATRKNVDDLRKFRNEEFAHIRQGNLSDPEFYKAIIKVHGAFQALGLPTWQIQDTKNQTTFPTEELRNVLKEVDGLKQVLQEKEDQLQEKEDQRQVLEDQLQKEIPLFCVLPPKPSHDIGGRNREVVKIVQQLRELKEANKNSLSYLYILGNPGSGKSQLAGLVAKRFFDEVKEMSGASPFVMTLNAASPDTLLESYVFFARQLKCPEYSVIQTLGSKDSKTGEKIASLKMLIAAKIGLYTSWLLVVDNVTSVSSVHVYLPEVGNKEWAKGQMLITTQDTTSIPLPCSFINHTSVSKGMEPDDACSLLAILSGIVEVELGKNVAQALDFQPLALASAATYVKQVRQNKASSHFGWNQYLEKLGKGQRSLTETILAETNPSYQDSMTAAITLAVEKQIKSDKVVNHLFTFLSLCAPQPLSLDIGINYITNVDEDVNEENELICMRIKRCSLLLFEEDDSGCFIRVHQVVYDAIKTVKNDEADSQHLQAVNGAITSFDQYIDAIPPENGHELNTLHIVPHLKALIKLINDVFSKESISQSQNKSVLNNCYPEKFQKLGNICEKHCEFTVAKTYYEHSLAIKLQNRACEHVSLARDYNDLGVIHQKLGDFDQAKEYHERALTIHLEKLGAEHVNVATDYNNLGVIHQKLGDFDQAKEYHERALTIDLEKLGAKNVNVARDYNNLGLIHQKLGDFDQAKKYHERALAICLEKLGAEHVDVARDYNNLGLIHQELGDFDQAKEYHKRALTIHLEKLGADHVDVAVDYNNLGVIHRKLGDFDQAKEYHERALAIRFEKLGAEHVDVARDYNNLGIIHRKLGDFDQAKEYHERALAIHLEKLGAEHVDVVADYNNLGVIHRKLGDFDQAKEYHERALAIRLGKLSAEHVDVATDYTNLGLIHQKLGDFDQAKEYHERALTIDLKKLGAKHVDVAMDYNNLGVIHRKLGDFDQAKEYHERALAIHLGKLGAEHVDVARDYNNLGLIHQKLGEIDQAKEYHERALTIHLEKLGAEHVDVATDYNNLGVIHQKLGEFYQAKEYHERALTIHLEKLGSKHVDVATDYSNLGVIHQKLGDFDQTKEYHECALAIRLEKLGAEHVDVAGDYNNLGLIHQELGDFDQAKEYYERALAIRLEKLGTKHVEVAWDYNNLGLIHWKLGYLDQAKEYLERAFAICLENLGAEHADVAKVYKNLGSIRKELGTLEQAKEYDQRVLVIEREKARRRTRCCCN